MRAEFVTFTLSVLINTAFLGGLDRMVQGPSGLDIQGKVSKTMSSQNGALEFQYVESPSNIPPQTPPPETTRISDHDSVAQGHIETQGPADQLEQRRGDLMQAPAALSIPRSPQPTQESAREKDVPSDPQTSELITMKDDTPPPQMASPASTPKAPLLGTPGNSRIMTQAFSREKTHGAQVAGVSSFDATGSGMGVYMKNLKEKIWLAWFPYLAFHYPKDFKTADVLIQFTLDKTGEVKSIQVVEKEGAPLFADLCVDAIQRAGSFGPIPQEVVDLMSGESLEIEFAFHYW